MTVRGRPKKRRHWFLEKIKKRHHHLMIFIHKIRCSSIRRIELKFFPRPWHTPALSDEFWELIAFMNFSGCTKVISKNCFSILCLFGFPRIHEISLPRGTLFRVVMRKGSELPITVPNSEAHVSPLQQAKAPVDRKFQKFSCTIYCKQLPPGWFLFGIGEKIVSQRNPKDCDCLIVERGSEIS